MRQIDIAEIHIWMVDPIHEIGDLSSLWDVLSREERAAAERFHFERDRHRSIVSQGTLRKILGAYTDTAPEDLQFERNRYGKPHMVYPDTEIRFNLSHSNQVVVYGIARGRELGIDVEYRRGLRDHLEIAKRFFSTAEQECLLALPPADRETAFFDCWTRKEAYIKAQGMGLSLPLDSFDVSMTPEPARLIATRHEPDAAGRWHLADLAVPEGYAGTVAAEGNDWRLVYRDPA